ncbi:FkbM family methyltransferase [bacterium]|nr:FkbM family methyltransferase [bacterium]
MKTESIYSALVRSKNTLLTFKLLRSFLRYLSLRRVIPFAIWKHFPAPDTFEVRITKTKSFKYCYTGYDYVGFVTYWGGAFEFENETSSLMAKYLKNAHVFLDIGAYTGFYTVLGLGLNPALKVISCEPVPENFGALTANVAVNKFENRTTLLNCAVAEKAGSVPFHVTSNRYSPSASLNPEGFRGKDGSLIEVECMTLDQIVNDLDKVDVIKVDVEGFEDKVLEGAKNTLATKRPVIFLEVNYDGPYQRLTEIFDEQDYTYFQLTDSGPLQQDEIIPDPKDIFRNYLAIPSERYSSSPGI